MKKILVTLAGVLLAVAPATAALASTGTTSSPTITFWAAPVPVIGSALSDASTTPNVEVKVGWTMTSPNGISHAHVNDCDPDGDYCPTVWTYSGSGAATSVAGKFQSWQSASESSYPDAYATDSEGNTSNSVTGIGEFITDSGGATYSSGWKTSQCTCYTNGSILYSTTPRATATFDNADGFGGLVSFVSDTGSTRGEVAITFNGKTTDVSLHTSGATKNRVIVWNSGYISWDNYSNLTIKVISGRVDVEGIVGNYLGN
jgi:hypothetical protein